MGISIIVGIVVLALIAFGLVYSRGRTHRDSSTWPHDNSTYSSTSTCSDTVSATSNDPSSDSHCAESSINAQNCPSTDSHTTESSLSCDSGSDSGDSDGGGGSSD